MEIGQKFNQLTIKDYFFYIDHYKKIRDFNTLGLYRSIIENNSLNLAEKIAVRDYAHKTFRKTFDFLQLKDPDTFINVSTLGQSLTVADKQQLWKNLIKNQQKILADKKNTHRNFGIYSKHDCGQDTCIWNGMMIRRGSWLMDRKIHFNGDKNKYQSKAKSDRRKSDRKKAQQMIAKELENHA